jgi:hypothetical protein
MFGAGPIEPSSLDKESKQMLTKAAKEEPKWEVDFSKMLGESTGSDNSSSDPESRKPGESPLERLEKELAEAPMDTSERELPPKVSTALPESPGTFLSSHLGKATISTPPAPKAGIESGKGDSSPPPQKSPPQQVTPTKVVRVDDGKFRFTPTFRSTLPDKFLASSEESSDEEL